MPIPTHAGTRSYFVFADVEPKEVMNFGVESGIPLGDDTTIEVFGHLVSFWTVTTRSDFAALRSEVQDLFDITLATYALRRLRRGENRGALPTRAVQHSWLEARDVEARANVVGTIHARYSTKPLEVDDERAADFTAAARTASKAVRIPTARIAFKDFRASLNERGDDAFLYTYRAIENVRRTYCADVVKGDGFEAKWQAMHDALGTSRTRLAPLTAAATSIRHGRASGEALDLARRRRETTLKLADRVLRAFARQIDSGRIPTA